MNERNDRERSYEQLHKVHNQAVAERDTLYHQYADVLNSHSWRLTRAFRTIRCYLITNPGNALAGFLFNIPRSVWRILPISPKKKNRLKSQLFTRLPFLFRRMKTYHRWEVFESHSLNQEAERLLLSEDSQQG